MVFRETTSYLAMGYNKLFVEIVTETIPALEENSDEKAKENAKVEAKLKLCKLAEGALSKKFIKVQRGKNRSG